MLPITISLSPNTQRDDVQLAWRMMLSPWRWREPSLAAVGQQLSEHINSLPVFLTSSGRSALYTLLRAAGIGSGDEVIIQAFTCLAVPAAVQWTGARPVYADILPNTFNLDPADVSRKISPHTKALVVQHTFGIPGPLAELQLLAKSNRLLLIEDCAHALGAAYNGKPAGTLSDAAIFSFGRDKALSSVFGGAIGSRDEKLLTRARELQRDYQPPPLAWIAQQLFHPIAMRAILPAYFSAHLGPALLVSLQTLGLLSLAVEPDEKVGAMPAHARFQASPALARLLEHQLHKLERYIARRQAIAHRYAAALASRLRLAEPLPGTSPSWLRFPLLVEDPAALLRRARQARMLLGNWYSSPIAPPCNLADFHYQSGSCPQAEYAAAHIINLPTYPRLTDEQIDRVISWIINNTPSAALKIDH